MAAKVNQACQTVVTKQAKGSFKKACGTGKHEKLAAANWTKQSFSKKKSKVRVHVGANAQKIEY